ncbi:MAG: ornithine carbamoyltransferase [Verrucomicrobia bacterium]|nr:ornithine carbamoyltransferase [Verrucomicrobiota bacterium]
MRHFLKLAGMREAEARQILDLAQKAKRTRGKKAVGKGVLAGQIWALIFTKASTRTRVSFEVAIRELGGVPSFLSAAEIQLGRGELVRDTARVMGRMVHGAVIRTFAQSDVEEFAEFARIPTINALTDDEHPCQILSDIFTIEEKLGPIRGKRIAFIGDAACNVPRSWAEAAEIFHFHFVCGAPKEFRPMNLGKNVSWTEDPLEAATGADVLYSDVWVSMGKEAEAAERERIFAPYQINRKLVARAKKNALVLHCLPAYRGKEITDEILEERADDIFDQAENRLHTQKGILQWIVSKPLKGRK